MLPSSITSGKQLYLERNQPRFELMMNKRVELSWSMWMWKANSRKQNRVCVLEYIFSYMHSFNNVSIYTQFCPWLISWHLKETKKLWMRQVCVAVSIVRSSPPVPHICVSGSSQRWFNGNRLIGTKPLPEPMLEYLQLDSWKKPSVKF